MITLFLLLQCLHHKTDSFRLVLYGFSNNILSERHSDMPGDTSASYLQAMHLYSLIEICVLLHYTRPKLIMQTFVSRRTMSTSIGQV